MPYIFTILISYCICCINPSYIIGRIRGVNVKKSGSKNAGASNALLLFGKTVGVACAIFDILKAFFAIKLCTHIFSDVPCIFAVAAVASILGHIFPFYIKFRGGKGLACLGGAFLAYDWRFFCIMFVIEVVFVLIVNYICFAPLTASVIFPVYYGIMHQDFISALILCIPAVVMFIKHIENLKRIMQGTEVRFSYLWNKGDEAERVTKNVENIKNNGKD